MPVATMIAGPNGSGKTTLTDALTRQGIVFGEYFNADDIAKTLTGDSMSIALAAQAEVRSRREAALRESRDYCFETVMSHPSHIDHLRDARNAGFETRLIFVATENPDINLGRVANRVLHGGHEVPEDRVVARYHRCLANLPAAVQMADYSLIFDNSSIAHPLRLIARARRDWALKKETLFVIDKVAPEEMPHWWSNAMKQFLNSVDLCHIEYP
jgi:predicted ABC-type ATPase